MTATIGFLGVGRMGGPMAGRLIDAGHRLVVHDVSEAAMAALQARGAARAVSPAEVADAAPIVFASLPTPAIVREAVLGSRGVVQGKALRLFVDLSTSGPAAAVAIAEGLGARGVAALDAPVSGGVAGAAKGTLAVMISGPRAAYEEVEPLLAVFGRLFFLGEKPGLGQTVKLANNLLSATAIAITSEAMAMGVKAGVDPSLMLDVFTASSGRNTATEDKFPRCVVPRRFDTGFAAGLLFKDVRLCLDEAEALGVPMVVGAAVRQILSITCNRFGPDSDCTEIAKVIESWANCRIGGEGSHEQ